MKLSDLIWIERKASPWTYQSLTLDLAYQRIICRNFKLVETWKKES